MTWCTRETLRIVIRYLTQRAYKQARPAVRITLQMRKGYFNAIEEVDRLLAEARLRSRCPLKRLWLPPSTFDLFLAQATHQWGRMKRPETNVAAITVVYDGVFIFRERSLIEGLDR